MAIKPDNFEAWGNVTNPESHNPDNFRYLVHAFNPFAQQSNLGLRLTLTQAGDLDRGNPNHGDQSVDLYQFPERLNDRVSVSMSLIDQSHRGTWSNGGMIIEAHPSNILITSESDLGSHNFNLDTLLWQASRSPLISGDILLQRSNPSIYNEVIALAKTGSHPLRITGFFSKVDEEGAINEVIAQKMQMHSSRLQLPYVEIPVWKEPFTEGLRVTPSGDMYTDWNGKSYHVGGSTEMSPFHYFTRRGNYFPSPENFERVLAFVAKHRPDLVKEIRDNYQKADVERVKAKLRFNDQGEVTSITKKNGYDKAVREYWIYGSGEFFDVILEEEGKYVTRMLTEQNASLLDSHWWRRQVSTSEADEIITNSLEGFDPKTQKKITNFYSAAREKNEKIMANKRSELGRMYTSFHVSDPAAKANLDGWIKEFGKIKIAEHYSFKDSTLLKGFSLPERFIIKNAPEFKNTPESES